MYCGRCLKEFNRPMQSYLGDIYCPHCCESLSPEPNMYKKEDESKKKERFAMSSARYIESERLFAEGYLLYDAKDEDIDKEEIRKRRLEAREGALRFAAEAASLKNPYAILAMGWYIEKGYLKGDAEDYYKLLAVYCDDYRKATMEKYGSCPEKDNEIFPVPDKALIETAKENLRRYLLEKEQNEGNQAVIPSSEIVLKLGLQEKVNPVLFGLHKVSIYLNDEMTEHKFAPFFKGVGQNKYNLYLMAVGGIYKELSLMKSVGNMQNYVKDNASKGINTYYMLYLNTSIKDIRGAAKQKIKMKVNKKMFEERIAELGYKGMFFDITADDIKILSKISTNSNAIFNAIYGGKE